MLFFLLIYVNSGNKLLIMQLLGYLTILFYEYFLFISEHENFVSKSFKKSWHGKYNDCSWWILPRMLALFSLLLNTEQLLLRYFNFLLYMTTHFALCTTFPPPFMQSHRAFYSMKSTTILFMFLAIGNNIFILLGLHVVVGQKSFLFSLLVIINISVDVETSEQHLQRHLRNQIHEWALSFKDCV